MQRGFPNTANQAHLHLNPVLQPARIIKLCFLGATLGITKLQI